MDRFSGEEFPGLQGKMRRGRVNAGWRSGSSGETVGGMTVPDGVKWQGV